MSTEESKEVELDPKEFSDDSDSDSGEDSDEGLGFVEDAPNSSASGMSSVSSEIGSKRQRDEDDDEDDADDVKELLQVDFGFYDLVKDDYLAIRNFLKNLFGNIALDFNELAELIAGQVEVGTTVKNDDDMANALGFITVINLHTHKEKKCVKQLVKWLKGKCTHKYKAKLNALLDDKSKPLGLLLHNRMINLPTELVPPLQKALQDDIKWAIENEEQSKDYKYANYIIAGSRFKFDNDDNDDQDGQRKKKKKKKKKANNPDAFTFKLFENEFYQQESFLDFSFGTASVIADPSSTPTATSIFAVSADNILKAVKTLNSLQIQ